MRYMPPGGRIGRWVLAATERLPERFSRNLPHFRVLQKDKIRAAVRPFLTDITDKPAVYFGVERVGPVRDRPGGPAGSSRIPPT